jgi:hypothetical protein
MMTAKSKLSAGLAITVATAAAAWAIAGPAMSDSEPAKKQSLDVAQARASVLDQFAVLRDTARSGSAVVSQPELAKLRATQQRMFGLSDDATSALRAAAARDDGTTRVLVSATTSGLCLTVKDLRSGSGSVGCTDPASSGDAARPLASSDAVGDNRWRVTALLVDGVSDVTLSSSEGTRPLTVDNNIATAEVSSGTTFLRWLAPDGSPHEMEMSTK